MNNRYGDDRWRDQDHDRGRDRDERGFFERAGDRARSWFGDDDDERRGEQGSRRWERGERDYRQGSENFGSGWGNQTGESWNRDRPGARPEWSAGSEWDRDRSRGDRDRERSRESGRYEDEGDSGFLTGGGGRGYDQDVFGEPYGGGTSGFGGAPDYGRRFDRVDPGHVGTHGTHPMSSPVSSGVYGGGYGISAMGGAGSSARYAAAQRQQSQGGRQALAGGAMGAAAASGLSGGRPYDPHYSEWRRRQIEELDRDYDEYCRENQSRFEQEFGTWRQRRGEQRQSLSKVTEHMEVVGSDGQHIGTVDKVRGDRVILTRNDENAGGAHHSIPCSWIDSVDDKVHVNKSRDEAIKQWRDEERSRALFEREDSGSEGPHVLNRSFSGTY